MFDSGIKQTIGRSPAAETLHNAAAAAAVGASIDTAGYSVVALEVTGTAAGLSLAPKVRFEAGSTLPWTAGAEVYEAGGSRVTAITENGLYLVVLAGYGALVAEIEAITSGTVTVKARAAHVPQGRLAAAPSGLVAGSVSVTSTAAAIGAGAAAQVQLQADPANEVNVLVGTSSNQTIVLAPGQGFALPAAELADVYAKTLDGTATLNWIAAQL